MLPRYFSYAAEIHCICRSNASFISSMRWEKEKKMKRQVKENKRTKGKLNFTIYSMYVYAKFLLRFIYMFVYDIHYTYIHIYIYVYIYIHIYVQHTAVLAEPLIRHQRWLHQLLLFLFLLSAAVHAPSWVFCVFVVLLLFCFLIGFCWFCPIVLLRLVAPVFAGWKL